VPTFVLSMLTFGTGRTNILFGLVHMVVFAVFPRSWYPCRNSLE
jgi:Ca2+:H+ antiporter